MKSSKLSDFITAFDTEGDNVVVAHSVEHDKCKRRVQINRNQYFGGVSTEVWEFHIGGYRVAEKWLKDRHGRKLSDDDLEHYQKIIVALSETRRIMSEIDDAIPQFSYRIKPLCPSCLCGESQYHPFPSRLVPPKPRLSGRLARLMS